MLDKVHTRAENGALLWRLVRDYGYERRWAYALSGLLLAFIGASNALVAWLIKPVLNGMVSAERFGQTRWFAFAAFGLFALRGTATFGSMITLSRIGNGIVAAAQNRVYGHLLRQGVGYFQDRHSSEFVARVTLAANGVRDALQLVVQGFARDVLSVAGCIAVMLYQDPVMALGALGGLPVAALLVGRIIKKVGLSARRSYDGSTQIMQAMGETVNGFRIVKAFTLEAEMRIRMAAAIRTVERAANRMSAGAGLAVAFADSLAGLVIGFAIFYAQWRVSVLHAEPGSFASFLAALLLAYEPAKRLGKFPVDIQNGLVGAKLIYEVLDAPEAEGEKAGLPALSVSKGRVEIAGARFAYRAPEYAVDGLDFIAEPNATTALVGPSGGGKSTILSLIQRFYELEKGVVRIDGQDVADVSLASLRDKIAFVSQDAFLFRGSIRDNIRLGKLDATDAEIEHAARMAHAHDFIGQFSGGYETDVGERGAQLSGGQRQRIAIARAMLKDTPILLLDEPTAALDSESEREVQKALDEVRVGRTTIVVAHRLQTIVGADRIWVIEGGRAVENGTHRELIARGGAYCAFFAAQFGPGAVVDAD